MSSVWQSIDDAPQSPCCSQIDVDDIGLPAGTYPTGAVNNPVMPSLFNAQQLNNQQI